MRKFFLIPLLMACLLSSAQTTTIRDVFKAMPDSLLPYLTQNHRLDFIDFMDSGMEAKVTNELGGTSVMTVLKDNYLHLRLSESSVLQIRLLPVCTPVDGMQQIICMVCTYGTSGQESAITFYSCSWSPLEMSVKVCADDLMVRPENMSVERFKEVKEMLKPGLIRAELSADDDLISFSLSDVGIPADDQQDVDAVKMSKVLKWNKSCFN